MERSFHTGPQSCEGHLAIILYKDRKKLIIKGRSRTIIYEVSHPSGKDDIYKRHGMERDFRSKRGERLVTENTLISCVFHQHKYKVVMRDFVFSVLWRAARFNVYFVNGRNQDGHMWCIGGGEDVGGTSAGVAQGQRIDRHQVLAIAGVQI